MSKKRLALTWFNQDKALLPTPNGGYEWVERNDTRVNEVRLLRETDRVGEVSGTPADNLLIVGDSFSALRSLASIPEYATEIKGKVKLVYIDPPFNTGQTFDDYNDNFEHSIWLSAFRDRLRLLRTLLRPDGTIWVHLDDEEIHRARVVMDEEFGADRHLATVTWQRTTAKTLASTSMAAMYEQILVYGASEAADLKPLFIGLDATYVAKRFTNIDERGLYDTGDLTATSYRPHLDSGKPWRGINPSDKRRCWAVPTGPLKDVGLPSSEIKALTMQEKLDALDAHGYIHWPSNGGLPRFKKYAHKARGRAVGDLWTDITVINSQAQERTGFATQKPEALIKRVMEMSTEAGDLVVDCYAGSGTTAAAAHKFGRRWVTIERERESVDKYIVPRLSSVVAGTEEGGITLTNERVASIDLPNGVTPAGLDEARKVLEKLVEAGALDCDNEQLEAAIKQMKTKPSKDRLWNGGGGFRVLRVESPNLEEVGGRPFLKDTVKDLGPFIAAQLGYSLTSDRQGVAGVKNRDVLVVVEGIVDEDQLRQAVSLLSDDETVTVAGLAVHPLAASQLAEMRTGSRVIKVPNGLFKQSKVIR